ncbi:MAG: AraC family transcriptional regulator [Pseudacidovorax sp.]|nr:AraC family transcriptional regulator [Pseudacidovorax sp.]
MEVEAKQAAQSAYQHTTLARVDCDAALVRLSELIQSQQLFVDPALSLPSLAARLDLTTHQLSELLNSRLGKSIARFVREQRIEAAKAMLCEEPSASVLSVGLAVGFAAQSNFYEAFRDIEGMTPGQYRKLQGVGTRR